MFDLNFPLGMDLSKISKIELIKWIRANVRTHNDNPLCLTSCKQIAELVLSVYKHARQE